MHAYDPLPPRDSATSYDDAYFGPLASMIPQRNAGRRGQQQAQPQRFQEDMVGLLQNLQQLRFGGIDGADAAGDREHDDDDADDIGPIPGGMHPAHEEHGEEGTNEDDEEDRDVQSPSRQQQEPQAPGMLQNLWNTLWGRAAPVEDASSDGET